MLCGCAVQWAVKQLVGMELSSGNSVKAYQGSYQWKATALFLVGFTDLMITCFADHYHNSQHSNWYPFALLG